MREVAEDDDLVLVWLERRQDWGELKSPSAAGVQFAITAPCGMKQKPSRIRGLAAVCASAVMAGTIASSSGSDSVTPAPRRNVRRGMCFLLTKLP